MGQAVVDLPDPLNPPAASAANTDDLLAELAGQEIDRMLADSESGRSADPIEPQTPPPTTDSAPVPQGNLLPAESSAPAVAANAPQLDEFLGNLAANEPEGDVSLAEFAAGKLRAKSIDELDAAERDALKNDLIDETKVGRPVPIYLRTLQWMNSPLDSCPDHVRELIGKIAILTMINAIAVLAYVLFFRHRGQ